MKSLMGNFYWRRKVDGGRHLRFKIRGTVLKSTVVTYCRRLGGKKSVRLTPTDSRENSLNGEPQIIQVNAGGENSVGLQDL